MAELKITKGLDGEISALKSVGSDLGSNTIRLSSDGLDLETCRKTIQQQREIADLLNQYRSLVLKDTKDLQSVVNAVRAADNTIATNIR